MYKFGKDKNSNQKYLCKECRRQFTLQSSKKHSLGYPKCPVCQKGMYLHHKYKYHASFKCNNRKCNHTIKQLIPTAIDDPSSEKLNGKTIFSGHRYNLNTIIISFKCNNRKCNHTIKQLIPTAIDDPSSEKLNGKTIFSGHRYNLNTIIMTINLYYSLNATTRAISTYLLDYMNIKVSHVTISKWIKKFDKYFKSISDELTNDLYLGDSDEWHADETVVKINGKNHYLWVCIDSETRFVTSWNLNQSRESECAFSLFKRAKTFGSPKSIVTDGLPSYREPVKNTFEGSSHIVVKDFSDDISNNLIESFNKTFKSWYKKTKGFKSYESANSLISNFIFYYNFIKNHSSLSNLTPAQVCGINYTHQEKVNWFIKY